MESLKKQNEGQSKIFALVDCNSFYCSCERIFRPELENTPVGVLSNNDGCFVSRTNELKALGVPMGAPYFKYQDLCRKNGVAVFSANFALYTNISDRVMRCLSRFSKRIEIYSVDEAFLDLTGLSPDECRAYGHQIREALLHEVGVPVSVGIANTKTLSKAANHIAKKFSASRGVVVLLNDKKIAATLKAMDIQDIWGIGRKQAQKLRDLQLKTAWQFQQFPNTALIQKLLTKVGKQTQAELQGLACFDLELPKEKKEQILCSRTFGRSVYKLSDLKEAIANFTAYTCEKLRKQNSYCQELHIFFRTNQYKNTPQYGNKASIKFTTPTADSIEIIRQALKLVEDIFKEGFEYNKGGVFLSGIRSTNELQGNLFEALDSSKQDSLMNMIDQINTRFGNHTIKPAACGTSQKAWKMRQVYKSPALVTKWSDLPKVY